MEWTHNVQEDLSYGHRPVLLEECLEALAIRPDGIYVDGTLGRAGHSLEIARRLTTGRLIGIDRDETAIAAARERLRKMKTMSLSVEEKMEEIRLVNRAKWLLIEQLKMTESDAHRYIEKQAMDRCVSRREIAQNIIRIYA